jgi:hypothetical protein
MSAAGAIHALAAVAIAVPLAACGEKEEPTVTGPRTETEQDVLANMTGSWRGELRQRGLKPFVVRATIRSPKDNRKSTVRYSRIDCSGTWTLSDVAGERARFREVIDRGRGGKCKGSGEVTLTLEGERRLGYVFRGGGVRSHGTLRRVG